LLASVVMKLRQVFIKVRISFQMLLSVDRHTKGRDKRLTVNLKNKENVCAYQLLMSEKFTFIIGLLSDVDF
jgi:hypothetical protein